MCCKSEISKAMLLFVCHDRLLLLATKKWVWERGQFKRSKAWALLGLQCLLDLFVLVACQGTSLSLFVLCIGSCAQHTNAAQVTDHFFIFILKRTNGIHFFTFILRRTNDIHFFTFILRRTNDIHFFTFILRRTNGIHFFTFILRRTNG